MMMENKFMCEYDLNGECQLYSLPCKDNKICTLNRNCTMCVFMPYGKNCKSCRECERGKEVK